MPSFSGRIAAGLCAATMMVLLQASAQAASGPSTWGGVCYVGFDRHVEHIAGPDAVDCGLHRRGASTLKSAARCMRNALKSGRTYKVVVISAADPVDTCHAAIEGAAALPVSLLYVRNSPLSDADNGRVLVQRCHDLAVPERPDDVRLFIPDDCSDARDLLPESMWSSGRGHEIDDWIDVRALPR